MRVMRRRGFALRRRRRAFGFLAERRKFLTRMETGLRRRRTRGRRVVRFALRRREFFFARFLAQYFRRPGGILPLREFFFLRVLRFFAIVFVLTSLRNA
jgi:hypothetical protein